MRFSVLVNAYTRTVYVEQALDSVLSQTSSQGMEVLVLTSRSDFSIPRKIEERAANVGTELKLLGSPMGPAGTALASALPSIRGEFVALLDDDDMFDPRKIGKLDEAIDQYPSLGFFHNSQCFVDESNRPLSRLNPHRFVRHASSRRSEGRRLVVDPRDDATIARGMAYEPGFNDSSIVIRRSILEENSALMRRLVFAEDTALYYFALLSGRPLLLTSDRLTRYRIHGGAMTVTHQGEVGSAARAMAYRNYALGHAASLEVVLAFARTRQAMRILRWIEREKLFWEVMASLASEGVSGTAQKEYLRRVLGDEPSSVTTRDLASGFLGSLSVISTSLARLLFLTWRGAW